MDNSNHNSSCGTHENVQCWYNSTDTTGLICSTITLMLILFTTSVIALGMVLGNFDSINGSFILFLSLMSFVCHLTTMISDPGTVPKTANPLAKDITNQVSICGRCDSYKPPKSHHDRISNRCISRMDHFCPWINNAIGAKNQKNFMLFLIYTNLSSIYAYVYIALHLVSNEINQTIYMYDKIILTI